MICNVISHDVESAIAVARFEHMGVTFEQEFDLGLVIPGTRKVFADLGLLFDEAAQLRALAHLTNVIELGIETGAINDLQSRLG